MEKSKFITVVFDGDETLVNGERLLFVDNYTKADNTPCLRLQFIHENVDFTFDDVYERDRLYQRIKSQL